jgi:hypothetical protein
LVVLHEVGGLRALGLVRSPSLAGVSGPALGLVVGVIVISTTAARAARSALLVVIVISTTATGPAASGRIVVLVLVTTRRAASARGFVLVFAATGSTTASARGLLVSVVVLVLVPLVVSLVFGLVAAGPAIKASLSHVVFTFPCWAGVVRGTRG